MNDNRQLCDPSTVGLYSEAASILPHRRVILLGNGAELVDQAQPQGCHILPDDLPPFPQNHSAHRPPLLRVFDSETLSLGHLHYGKNTHSDGSTTRCPLLSRPWLHPCKELLGPREHLKTGALCPRPSGQSSEACSLPSLVKPPLRSLRLQWLLGLDSAMTCRCTANNDSCTHRDMGRWNTQGCLTPSTLP